MSKIRGDGLCFTFGGHNFKLATLYKFGEAIACTCGRAIRATSHTRLRAHDHSTLSTLIGGKGGAGPSSLRTMLEGPTEYVNVTWM